MKGKGKEKSVEGCKSGCIIDGVEGIIQHVGEHVADARFDCGPNEDQNHDDNQCDDDVLCSHSKNLLVLIVL